MEASISHGVWKRWAAPSTASSKSSWSMTARPTTPLRLRNATARAAFARRERWDREERRNLGAQHAGGEILAFVDADVVMPPGGLCLIAEDFCRDPELAAVFGSYDDKPAWTTFISQYKNLMHHYVHQTSSESAATFWAGCGAVRKTIFEEFNGFDGATYTVPSIEDIAFGLELTRSGRKIQLDKRLDGKTSEALDDSQSIARRYLLSRGSVDAVDLERSPSPPRPEPDLRFTRQFPAGGVAGHRLRAVAVQLRRRNPDEAFFPARRDGARQSAAADAELGCVSVLSAQARLVVRSTGGGGPLGLLLV